MVLYFGETFIWRLSKSGSSAFRGFLQVCWDLSYEKVSRVFMYHATDATAADDDDEPSSSHRYAFPPDKCKENKRTIDLEGTNVPKTSGNVFVSQKGLKIKSVFEDLW